MSMFKNKTVNTIWTLFTLFLDVVLAYFILTSRNPIMSYELIWILPCWLTLAIGRVYFEILLEPDAYKNLKLTIRHHTAFWLFVFNIVIHFVLFLPLFPVAYLLGINNVNVSDWYMVTVLISQFTGFIYNAFKIARKGFK